MIDDDLRTIEGLSDAVEEEELVQLLEDPLIDVEDGDVRLVGLAPSHETHIGRDGSVLGGPSPMRVADQRELVRQLAELVVVRRVPRVLQDLHLIAPGRGEQRALSRSSALSRHG